MKLVLILMIGFISNIANAKDSGTAVTCKIGTKNFQNSMRVALHLITTKKDLTNQGVKISTNTKINILLDFSHRILIEEINDLIDQSSCSFDSAAVECIIIKESECDSGTLKLINSTNNIELFSLSGSDRISAESMAADFKKLGVCQ